MAASRVSGSSDIAVPRNVSEYSLAETPIECLARGEGWVPQFDRDLPLLLVEHVVVGEVGQVRFEHGASRCVVRTASRSRSATVDLPELAAEFSEFRSLWEIQCA